jgi:hypothetical protein
MLLAAIALAILSAWAARAHDHWINSLGLVDPVSRTSCCSANDDCFEVERGGVREVQGGFFVQQTGEVIAIERIIWKSPDGKWWRCHYKNGLTRCLIGPPRSAMDQSNARRQAAAIQ